MKTLCQICNVEGFLERRGSNARIKHYLGFENGKRRYEYHTVCLEKLIPIDSQKSLGINKVNLSPEGAKEPRAGFGPATITLPR